MQLALRKATVDADPNSKGTTSIWAGESASRSSKWRCGSGRRYRSRTRTRTRTTMGASPNPVWNPISHLKRNRKASSCSGLSEDERRKQDLRDDYSYLKQLRGDDVRARMTACLKPVEADVLTHTVLGGWRRNAGTTRSSRRCGARSGGEPWPPRLDGARASCRTLEPHLLKAHVVPPDQSTAFSTARNPNLCRWVTVTEKLQMRHASPEEIARMVSMQQDLKWTNMMLLCLQHPVLDDLCQATPIRVRVRVRC